MLPQRTDARNAKIFVKTTCATFPNFLRVLGVLRGFFLLTAERAETAKFFVKITCSTFLNPLRALSALRGFIFNNRRARRARKVFCKDYLLNFPHYSLRTLRPLRFYF